MISDHKRLQAVQKVTTKAWSTRQGTQKTVGIARTKLRPTFSELLLQKHPRSEERRDTPQVKLNPITIIA